MTEGETGAMPETEDFLITYGDVEGLIDTLSEIADKLPRGQWGLLLSIFAASPSNLEVGDDKTRGTFSGIKIDGGVITYPRNKKVEELRRQLREAHMPGKSPSGPFKDMIIPPKKKPRP